MPYSVTEAPRGSAGRDTDDKGFATDSATREFLIVAPSTGYTAPRVRVETQLLFLIPRNGYSLPEAINLICRTVSVTQESPIVFKAVANYRSMPKPEDQEDELSPWEQPATIAYDSLKTEAETDEDADGKPIRNIGTDEPVTGITKPITDLVITVNRAIRGWQAAEILQYEDATNTAEFIGFPKGVVKVDKIRGTEKYYDGIYYADTTYVFIARKSLPHIPNSEAWYHRRIHKGFYEWTGSRMIRCVDDEKNPVTTPVLLDETGARLAAGAEPHIIATKRLESKDLGQLQLFN